MGLLWDIADAAAYFCSQRRARTQRIRVPARCPATDVNNRRCVFDVGHAQQHANAGVWNYRPTTGPASEESS